MGTVTRWAIVAAVIVAGAAGYWWYSSRPQPVVGTIVRAPAPTALPASTDPGAAAPAEASTEPAAPAEPLPALADSDGFLVERLGSLWPAGKLPAAIASDRLARRLVATADALPREGVPIEARLVRAVPGRLLVTGPEDAPLLDPANGARYETYVKWLEELDANRVVATYRGIAPLLQAAYERIGYPDRRFDARLVAVIDDLLATPDVREPIPLARPHVLYTYADPALERRSAGQKAMLRLGHERAARVKSKLREFRAALVAAP